MQRAILRLFNAVLTDTQSSGSHRLDVTERSLRHGYILDPSINPDDFLLNNIENIVGRSGIKANSAFHKSWDIVRNTSMEQLVGQQIIHYLTTYGFESLGIYKKESVFIPHEVLELPAINEDLPLIVIKAINLRDLEKAIVELVWCDMQLVRMYNMLLIFSIGRQHIASFNCYRTNKPRARRIPATMQ